MPKQKGVAEKERSDVPCVAMSPPDREAYERAVEDVLEQMRQKQAQLVSTLSPLCPQTCVALDILCACHLYGREHVVSG